MAALKIEKIHPSWLEEEPELIERLLADTNNDPLFGFPWGFVVGLLVVNALSFVSGLLIGHFLW